MTKFKKRPVEIEARQFTEETKDAVYAWACSIQQNVIHTWKDDKPALLVTTLEGDMVCSLGDWLIVEPFPTDWRKIYPCKAEIFNQTYEPLI